MNAEFVEWRYAVQSPLKPVPPLSYELWRPPAGTFARLDLNIRILLALNGILILIYLVNIRICLYGSHILEECHIRLQNGLGKGMWLSH